MFIKILGLAYEALPSGQRRSRIPELPLPDGGGGGGDRAV
jgi:hypothetical protein